MMKDLPLSIEHSLLCYGDDSYNDSIASSQEYISKTLSVISDVSLNGIPLANLELQKEFENLSIEIDDGIIYASADLYCNQFKAALIFKAADSIDLSFKVNKHVPLNSWSNIAAFIMTGQNKKIIGNQTSDVHLFGKFSKRGFFYNNQNDCDLLSPESSISFSPYYIRIQSHRQTMIFSVSFDSINWIQLCTKDIVFEKQITCGILLDFGEAEYYNWLFSRHIQVYCPKKLIGSARPIDYFYMDSFDGVEKHNPHVKQFCTPKRLIPTSTEEAFGNFIFQAIEKNQYVDICLDEFYIENRWAYKKQSFLHYNMIYGYDNENKLCHVLGYNQIQKLSVSEVSLHDIYQAFIRGANDDVFLRQYNSNDFSEHVNYKIMLSEIDDYLNGDDSATRYPYSSKERADCCFGIATYDVLMESNDNLSYMTKDLRIPYFILEHKKLMSERVEFLICKLQLESESAKALTDRCSMLLREANIVLMLSIKAHIKGVSDSVLKSIAKHLNNLREIEKILLMNLYFKLVKVVGCDEEPY